MWEYSGQGLQFQVLVGPAFIVVFTISGVVAGFLADRVSRPALLAASVLLFSTSLILTGGCGQQSWLCDISIVRSIEPVLAAGGAEDAHRGGGGGPAPGRRLPHCRALPPGPARHRQRHLLMGGQ